MLALQLKDLSSLMLRERADQHHRIRGNAWNHDLTSDQVRPL